MEEALGKKNPKPAKPAKCPTKQGSVPCWMVWFSSLCLLQNLPGILTRVVSWDDCGAYTTSPRAGHRGHLWSAPWVFQAEVTCGRREKASSSQCAVASLVRFHTSAARGLVFLEQKLDMLNSRSSQTFNQTSLCGNGLFLCSSSASTKQLLNEGGKRKQCVTAGGVGPVLWEVELEPWRPCGFCLLKRRWEEVDLKLCQIPCCSFSLSFYPRAEWSLITKTSGCLHSGA